MRSDIEHLRNDWLAALAARSDALELARQHGVSAGQEQEAGDRLAVLDAIAVLDGFRAGDLGSRAFRHQRAASHERMAAARVIAIARVARAWEIAARWAYFHATGRPRTAACGTPELRSAQEPSGAPPPLSPGRPPLRSGKRRTGAQGACPGRFASPVGGRRSGVRDYGLDRYWRDAHLSLHGPAFPRLSPGQLATHTAMQMSYEVTDTALHSRS